MQKKETLSQRLKYAIKNKFTNQRKVAIASETDETLMSHYCSGRKEPSPAKTIKICGVLNISPHWLRDGIGSIKDEFNDYLFEEIRNNPQINMDRIRLINGSNGCFELTFLLQKDEIKLLFNQYLKIL